MHPLKIERDSLFLELWQVLFPQVPVLGTVGFRLVPSVAILRPHQTDYGSRSEVLSQA